MGDDPASKAGNPADSAGDLLDGKSSPQTSPTSPSIPPAAPPATTNVRAAQQKSNRRLLMYTAGVLVVVLIVVIAGSVVIPDIHPKSSASSPNLIVLVPKDTLYIIPYEQFSSSVFTINGTATVNGTIDQTGGIDVYTMTPEQVLDLAKSGTVSGYEWMTSLVTNGTVYAIDLTFRAGTWDVVFLNPNTNPNNSSSVGFLTGLYLLQT